MNIPVEAKPAIWGAIGGAVIVAIVGFTWGGWVTGKKAEAAAVERVTDAVVTALAPICVEKFNQSNDSTANLAALKALDSWSRGEYVQKGGWATFATGSTPEQTLAVSNACASLLTTA